MRFNPNSRFVRNAATSKVFVNQSVDHRPRALLVSGFESDEIDAVVKHFAVSINFSLSLNTTLLLVIKKIPVFIMSLF